MPWKNNWRVQTIAGVLNGRLGDGLVDRLNQFFAFNPCITCLQLEANWANGASNGEAGLLVDLHYTQPYGVRYFAQEFRSIGSLSAASQASDFFSSQPYYSPILMKDVTPPEVRYNDQRILVIYTLTQDLMDQDLFMVRGAVANSTIAAGGFGIGTDDIDPTRNPFPLYNVGNNDWPEGAPHLAIKYPGFGNVWGGIGPSTYPIVQQNAVSLPIPVCANPDLCDPIATTTFTPPPVISCQRTRYECECINGVDTWVLKINECIDNAFCDGNTICTHEVFDTNLPNACPAGGPVPAPLPVVACEPRCCPNPPPTETPPPPPTEPGTNCHRTVYECQCILGVDTWVLKENECVPNWMCSDPNGTGFVIWCAADEWEQNILDGCPAGGPVPAAPVPPLKKQKADGTGPDPLQDCEPVCCDATQCHNVEWECVCVAGEPTWVLITDECTDNDSCSDGGDGKPVITCTAKKLTYQLRDACDPDKPATPPTNKADGNPCEPACCEGMCHKFELECKYSDGRSFWIENSNECVDNDECSCTSECGAPPKTECTEGQDGATLYTYEDRNACDDPNDPPAVIIPDKADCDPGCGSSWKIKTLAFAEGNTACVLTPNNDYSLDCQSEEDLGDAVRAAMDGRYSLTESPGGAGCNKVFTCCTARYRNILEVEVGNLGIVNMDFEDDILPGDYNDGQIFIVAEKC